MQKFIYILMGTFVIATLLLVTGCGKTETKNPDVKDITDKLIDEIDFATLTELDDDRLDFFYKINDDIIDSYSAYICGSAGFPDEIAVFKLKDSANMQQVKEAIANRRETLVANFKDYRPEEMPKIDSSVLFTKGDYVIFVVSGENDKAGDIVKDFFN